MKTYTRISGKVKQVPIRASKRREIYEILKLVYTPEEAKLLASSFDMPFLDPKTVEEVSDELGLTREHVEKVFRGLQVKEPSSSL